eukprot:TRINITY_DN8650_c0_g1_i1.p1 TRINITY_DN8650_c0_g1~~TRINITY_DN8650_c0_g1_i1.p1  ORF type:complete len:314 (-),score=96.64 TRINITY_DN8650_c0_g1_i1:6-947(-)
MLEKRISFSRVGEWVCHLAARLVCLSPLRLTGSEAKNQAGKWRRGIRRTSTLSCKTSHLSPLLSPAKHLISLRSSLVIMKDPFFYRLVFVYFSGVAAGLAIIADSRLFWKSFSDEEDEEIEGNLGVGLSLCTCIGGILSGNLSDRFAKAGIRRAKALAVFFAFGCVVLFCLALTLLLSDNVDPDATSENPTKLRTSGYVLLSLASLDGLVFGATLSLIPTVCVECYGPPNFGKFFGYLQIGSTLAAAFVPILSSQVAKAVGNYSVSMFSLSACLFLGFFALYLPYDPFFPEDGSIQSSKKQDAERAPLLSQSE